MNRAGQNRMRTWVLALGLSLTAGLIAAANPVLPQDWRVQG